MIWHSVICYHTSELILGFKKVKKWYLSTGLKGTQCKLDLLNDKGQG
jgi:hypothetical protein